MKAVLFNPFLKIMPQNNEPTTILASIDNPLIAPELPDTFCSIWPQRTFQPSHLLILRATSL